MTTSILITTTTLTGNIMASLKMVQKAVVFWVFQHVYLAKQQEYSLAKRKTDVSKVI